MSTRAISAQGGRYLQLNHDIFYFSLFHIFKFIRMGNNNSDMTESEFRQKWKQSGSYGSLSVWENKENPDQKVEQYTVRETEVDFNEKLYQLRKNSPFLVNAYALRNEGFSCQVDHDAKKLFVERIPLRLSNVENIPYPDVFHLYDSCIHGYSQLTNEVGYFSIDQDQIGINEKGKVKVWLSNLFQSYRTSGARITEPAMVRELLEVIKTNTDHSTRGRYPDISWYIGSHQNITFREVNDKFIQYIKEYNNGQMPDQLNCVFEHGGSGIIENWCRNHQSYGYSGSQIRAREEYYRNKVTGAMTTGIVSPQVVPESVRASAVNVSTSSVQPQTSQQVRITPAPQQIQITQAPRQIQITQAPQPVQINQAPQQIQITQAPQQVQIAQAPRQIQITQAPQPIQQIQITQQAQPVQVPQRVEVVQTFPQAPQPQGSQIIKTVTVPNPQNFANMRRIQLGGSPSQVKLAPRVEERVISEKIIEGAPFLQQNIQVINGPSGQSPNVSSPVYTRQVNNGGSAVNSRNVVVSNTSPQVVKMEKQQSTSALQNAPDQIFTNPPQVVQSVYNRPAERSATSKILQNLQGTTVTENKGDFVTASVPTGFNENNRLQQQRVISQTIELKDGATGLTSIPENSWQTFTKKTETAGTDLNTFGRTVPYSFNVDETKNFSPTKVDSSKFIAAQDGKSSAQFLAFLNEIKSGAGKTNFSQGLSQNQKLGSAGSNVAGYGTTFDTLGAGTTSYQTKQTEFKVSTGDYNFQKYQANIDPDLQSDILKFKQ